MNQVVVRLAMLLLGVASALAAAVAVTVFAMWVVDQSPGSAASRELGVSVVLALVAAACAFGRRWLQVRYRAGSAAGR
jgi:hypothetical protein